MHLNKHRIHCKPIELPSPPSGKKGWPWTHEERDFLSARAQIDWPKISIVTPSFNQGRFIEATIRSILLQDYPNLEYIIIDGGSTDNTLEIIRRYEPWISYWLSEPDSGMYEAINKGFAKSIGDILAWSPTGDFFKPKALSIIGSVFAQFPWIEWLTSLYKTKCDEDGIETACYPVQGFDSRAFRKGFNFPNGSLHARYTIQQQSTFWRRNLWKKAGGRIDDSFQGAGDFDLWCRFFEHTELYAVDQPIGVFRTHYGQISVRDNQKMWAEQALAFERTGGKCMGRIEGFLRRSLLRRRPFTLLKKLQFVGFPARIIHWSGYDQPAQIKGQRFA